MKNAWLLVGMALSTMLALGLIAVAGALLVMGEGTVQLSRGSTTTPATETKPAERASASTGASEAAADVEVRARHLGNLRLRIEARVSMNQAREPLTQAQVVAYTDMAGMPGAHGQGPLVMKAVPGVPGIYAAESSVPMPGDYDVRVEVQAPVSGEAIAGVPVGVAGSGR